VQLPILWSEVLFSCKTAHFMIAGMNVYQIHVKWVYVASCTLEVHMHTHAAYYNWSGLKK